VATLLLPLREGGEDFHLGRGPAEGPPPGSGLGARGWGLIRPQGAQEEEQPEGGSSGSSGSSGSTSMASELRMTRKCVLSDGAMVSSLCSDFSFLLTCEENSASNKLAANQQDSSGQRV